MIILTHRWNRCNSKRYSCSKLVHRSMIMSVGPSAERAITVQPARHPPWQGGYALATAP
jgi:hypothetical protein